MSSETELFPAETVAMESPRLRWMKRHDVTLIENKHVKPGQECELTGEPVARFCASRVGNKGLYSGSQAGFGQTAEEACADLAQRNGWRLWNEEDV